MVRTGEAAERGESIGITKRGKLVAVIGPAQNCGELNEFFAGMEAIRKRAKKMPGSTMKSLIEEGRMEPSKTHPCNTRKDGPRAR